MTSVGRKKGNGRKFVSPQSVTKRPRGRPKGVPVEPTPVLAEIIKEGETVLDYLHRLDRQIIQRIDHIARLGEAGDSVKLKANIALLNKILPDLTRADLEIRSEAPYKKIAKFIENEATAIPGEK